MAEGDIEATQHLKTRMIDAHIHLSDEAYTPHLDSISSFIENTGLILFTVSMGLSSSKLTLDLSTKIKNTYPFIGVHPWSCTTEDINSFTQFAEQSAQRVAGIGEIGLDRKYAHGESDYNLQLQHFHKQLEISEKLGKPVSVHSRGSQDDVLTILPSYRVSRVLLHWFSGSEEQLKKAMSRGYFISLGPPLVYSNRTRRLASLADRTLVLTETDGPVNYGACFEGRMAFPSFLTSVVFALSEQYKMPLQETCDLLRRNSSTYLGVKL